MKIRLICVGRLSLSFIRDGAAEYRKRLQRYLPVEIIELKEEKSGGKTLPDTIRSREGRAILDQVRRPGRLWALDEKGQQTDSAGLARLIEQEMTAGSRYLNVVIGGAWGLSAEVTGSADRVLSLSRLTFTHQMARLIALEQLYRGLTIIRNEPYHNA
ncbi:23S rRNA (pseudouridine1915-N3)-methyltransferase [Geothermobacter ehrlichii]|uniref:Ribosomal RNA large subunit methyltransferase H n=1 Tax=Geothermobacter ehrlichii TaxID=213224 RepID=A0A5D3WFI9_9BACT|nr:23S rRNA (pseudouridine(1915)-N(3))-methyltransferase RlmH [Geothermobacter ehrlichii]TYO96619.1 23S rRNA (pseudouridine1915-N3)-methyltransferase [Geothermobacter ehrlichii]